MANEIRDAFNSVYADGRGSLIQEPAKHRIRDEVGDVIQRKVDEAKSAAQAAAEGYKVAVTWVALSASAGMRDLQPGRVTGPDAGTHADPVSGETVANEGEYSWHAAANAWQRAGELLVSKTAPAAANFVDALGFVGARIDAAGTFLQNSPDRSFELLDTMKDSELLSVSDERGFKALSLTAEEFRAVGLETDIDGEFNADYDASPLIAGHLVGFSDSETHLYVRNIMRERSDLSRVRATVYSEAATDGSRLSYRRTGDDDIFLDLKKCASTVRLHTRLSEQNPDQNHFATLSTAVAALVPGSTVKVLLIGDSITNRQMAAWMTVQAAARDCAIEFIGTLNGAGLGKAASDATGPLGEAREGWEFGDFTYGITDRVTIVQPGDEANYLAENKNTKWPQNPFLRAATGADSASVVRNGYVFDPAFYLTRFGLATPDLVLMGLGTNDVRDRDNPELGAGVTDGLEIICNQILAALPAAKIALWFPPVSRSVNRDALWTGEYVEVISRHIRFVRAKASARLFLLPTWAMTSQEIGFPVAAGAVSDLGIETAPLSDTIHLDTYNIAACAEILAAAAACVAQGKL